MFSFYDRVKWRCTYAYLNGFDTARGLGYTSEAEVFVHSDTGRWFILGAHSSLLEREHMTLERFIAKYRNCSLSYPMTSEKANG